MLNIHIDNPDVEKSLKQTYGDDEQSIVNAFMEFVQQQRIKKDIGISIQQLDNGEKIPLKNAMKQIRSKYE
ncbi:MAG: hypothetical protein ABUK01_12315 [Leptospirales bacterium]